jgi:hypothetical protein
MTNIIKCKLTISLKGGDIMKKTYVAPKAKEVKLPAALAEERA